MDEFDIQSQPGQGTVITCRRWVRIDKPDARPYALEIGAATHPHPLMEVNGDAFVIKRWHENTLVAVIDGVGHGPPAFQAAQAARQYIENHFDQPLEMIFRNVGYACRATRGVVMALAHLDRAQSKLTFASIGNVEARVFGGSEAINFIVRRGVVGYNAPSATVTEHRWEPQNLMVLHTDGVKTSWRPEDFPALMAKPASDMAQALLQALDRGDDDATVVVVRGGVS
jgi:serine/threonine protein phosphatase PrpC